MKIAFLGLGKMGGAMARNLAAAEHTLTVYNRTREKAQPFAEAGARVANSPAEAVQGADVVFTMLANDAAVSQTVADFAPSLGPQAIHIGSSTISVDLAKRLAADHAKAGQQYLSAPVFGRPDAAEKKRLVVAVAGEPSLVDHVRPLLGAIGRETFTIGNEPWQANAVKLCGNFMIASMLETFSEAFSTLRKSGLDPHQFLNVIVEVFGSPVYTNYGRQMADARYDTAGAGFALALGLKDIKLVSQFAESVEAPMPLASLLRDHLLSAIANGQGELDWTSLSLVNARAAGLEG